MTGDAASTAMGEAMLAGDSAEGDTDDEGEPLMVMVVVEVKIFSFFAWVGGWRM